jgi:hypothetical protein
MSVSEHDEHMGGCRIAAADGTRGRWGCGSSSWRAESTRLFIAHGPTLSGRHTTATTPKYSVTDTMGEYLWVHKVSWKDWIRDGNVSGSGRVDEKSDPKKNMFG